MEKLQQIIKVYRKRFAHTGMHNYLIRILLGQIFEAPSRSSSLLRVSTAFELVTR
jgi:hypothetical protein